MRPCRCAHVRSRPRRPGTLVGPASGEVLSLDIEKLDLANRQARCAVPGLVVDLGQCPLQIRRFFCEKTEPFPT